MVAWCFNFILELFGHLLGWLAEKLHAFWCWFWQWANSLGRDVPGDEPDEPDENESRENESR